MRRVQVPGASWSQVESHARTVLESVASDCLLTPKQVPLLEIFEGGLAKYGIGYGVEELAFGLEAQFDPATNEILLSEQVYEYLHANQPRARFTVAHEIGHATMHGSYYKEIIKGNRKALVLNRGEIPAYADPEKQANRFASEFLMPTPLVRKLISEGANHIELARIFHVSFSAAEIKYNNVKNLGL